MDPRLAEILGAARRLAPDARAAFLDRACGDDHELRTRAEAALAADPAATLILEPGASVGGGEESGQVIDRYRLRELLGEGGFGSVWLADQIAPVQRPVALKVIKLGMDTRQVMARFETERQTLAIMDHPHIARVYDAGATATGRPYFVMELVDGVPIKEFCDTQALNTRQRLELFMDVCRAIQHAHQKGIIHRDIKPSNILVSLTDGRPIPKVIDFGIAKATATELTRQTVFTEQRQIIGTPAYMSPEQAALSDVDIDTRSDIYSLGILLYELLTGVAPIDTQQLLEKGYSEMMRIIREESPQRPSARLATLGDEADRVARVRQTDPQRLRHQLRGDLDWIVMKCLEKDRARRYDSATGLADDIARHLGDEPVIAGPPGFRYRLGKFVRRHRVAVATVGAVLGVLVLGIIGTAIGLSQAIREKERALAAEAQAAQRALELEQVAAFQSAQLGDIPTAMMGAGMRRQIEDRRRAHLMLRQADDASLDTALAELDAVLVGVNFTDVALAALDDHLFQRTLTAIATQFADQPLLQAHLLQTVSLTMSDLGLYANALAPQVQAIAIRSEHLGQDHVETLDSRNHRATLLRHLGLLDEAEAVLPELLATCRHVLGDVHRLTLSTLNNLAGLYWEQGRLDAAEPLMREAETIGRALDGEHPRTIDAILNMGSLLNAQGRVAEAEPYYREAVELHRRVHGPDHRSTLWAINSLAQYLRTQDRLEEAEAYILEGIAACRRVLGDEHIETLLATGNLAYLLQSRGEFDEAEALLRETLRTSRRALGAENQITLTMLNNLGSFLHDMMRYEEAVEYYTEGLDIRRRLFGAEHQRTLISMNNLGDLLRDIDRLDESAALLAEAVATSRRVLGSEHWYTGLFLLQHSRTLHELKEPAAGLPLALEAHTIFSDALGPEHWRTQGAVTRIVNLYLALHAAEPEAGHDHEAAAWRARLTTD